MINYRWERIERLFYELQYEIERGMLEGEVSETIGFHFIVPRSRNIPDGIVDCRFNTRPITCYEAMYEKPKLKVVK